MNNFVVARLLFIGATFVIGLFVWSSLFRTPDTLDINPVGRDYTDPLSGEFVTKESINNITKPNPTAPSFIGFDGLDYYTVSDDELRYLQDFLTNYTLYTKQAEPGAIISLVKDSFRGPFLESEGFVKKYSFQFGINGADLHTVQAAFNSSVPSIDITIEKNGKAVDQKKFRVYYL